MLLDIIDYTASSLWRGRANRKQARHDADLRARGVLAPAVVVKATTHGGRKSVDGEYTKIRYTVDVYPQASAPFRTELVHWSERRGYTVVMGEIMGEAGKQIWVTYDPSNPAEMIFEYDEQERLRRWHEADLEARRIAFDAAAEPLEPLRQQGSPAHAMIVHVEDLQLPYPRRNSTAVALHLDVSAPGASPYRAVVPALISVTALTKYSAGRQVFVRIDPRDSSRVVLDAERNRALPV